VQGTACNVQDHGLSSRNIAFKYDALGRRIEKREDTGNSQSIYQYLYDNLNIIAINIKRDGEEFQVTIVHDEVLDTPLSISSKKGRFYYHRDHQGSIVALSDEQGEIVETLEYDHSYGQLISHTQSVETFNPFGYTGREMDAGDLYYYRTRYYDPGIQRFLSKDPIEALSGDMNFYAYVSNDPVNYIDPYGYKGKCVSPAIAKKLLKYGKRLGRKLGAAFAKRVATTVASLATGPGAVLVAIVNIGASLWDLYKAFRLISNTKRGQARV